MNSTGSQNIFSGAYNLPPPGLSIISTVAYIFAINLVHELNQLILSMVRDAYESLLCEVDPWSKMEVHHMKRNNRNYIRTESVSQRRRSDSFTFLPNF